MVSFPGDKSYLPGSGLLLGMRAGRLPPLATRRHALLPACPSACPSSLAVPTVLTLPLPSHSLSQHAMFHLGSPDVLPVGDLGVRKGMQTLYGLKVRSQLDEYKQLQRTAAAIRGPGGKCRAGRSPHLAYSFMPLSLHIAHTLLPSAAAGAAQRRHHAPHCGEVAALCQPGQLLHVRRQGALVMAALAVRAAGAGVDGAGAQARGPLCSSQPDVVLLPSHAATLRTQCRWKVPPEKKAASSSKVKKAKKG